MSKRKPLDALCAKRVNYPQTDKPKEAISMARMTQEERYMREAIRLAKKAAALKEVPIGCVIVYDGKIIGRGYNRRTIDKNVLAHAEIVAIRKACRVLGDWRLEDCTMYVTLEPCPMCAGAIVQARVPKVVIGCMNPKAGCAGSVLDMLHEDGFNHQVETEIGLMGDVCSQMLKDFFKELREEGKRKKKEEALARETGGYEKTGSGVSGDHGTDDHLHQN